MNEQYPDRDLVGAMEDAVHEHHMRFGVYYSGGYDWTFLPGPIEKASDYESVKPQSKEYGRYVDAQYRELIERYHPAVLFNDIDYPMSGHPSEIEAEYYNVVPDGVVDDRFGIKHAGYTTPEYESLKGSLPKKWEECRRLGQSFGYNRAEGENQTISAEQLIDLLVDVVSKKGNLLLDIGLETDGTIPRLQAERLDALGSWLKQNGDGIYGTRPWRRSSGRTSDGIPVRFTKKDKTLFMVIMGTPKETAVTFKEVSPSRGAQIFLLGENTPLTWSLRGKDSVVELPSPLPGKVAFVLAVNERPAAIQASRVFRIQP